MRLSLVRDEGDVVLVEAEGSLTASALTYPIDPLAELLTDQVYGRKVMISFAGATMIDSSGLGWLVVCQKRFKQAGGTMVLYELSPMVRQTIQIVRLDRVLQLAETLTEARRRLDGAAG